MFILDTNVISELRKAKDGRADRNVTAWASGIPVGSLFLSVISVFELEKGVRSKERSDPAQGALLRAWLSGQVFSAFDGRVLPIDSVVAQRCAGLHVPNPRSERDAFIAATAMVHSMTVVTRNLSDFEATGVPLLNPWIAA